MRDAFVAAGDDQWVGIEVLADRNVPSYAAMLLGWSEGRDSPRAGGLPTFTGSSTKKRWWASASCAIL